MAVRVGPRPLSPSAINEIESWIRRKNNKGVWSEKALTKSDGSTRTIHAPCQALKRLLRRLNTIHLAPLDDSEYSFCRRKMGVLRAVRAHRSHPTLLHRDISSFFPSITQQRVRLTLSRRGFPSSVAAQIAAICTIDGVLVQGSPTSVSIGNLVLQRLDTRIGTLCKKHGLTYTRYVDDIAISGGHERMSRLAARIDDIIAKDGWQTGVKGGLYPSKAYREYLGVEIGPQLRVGGKAKLKALVAHQELERGDISYAEFVTRTDWVRAIEGAESPLLQVPAITQTSR